MGITGSVLFLLCCHLVAPVNSWIAVSFCLVGLMGLVYDYPEISGQIRLLFQSRTTAAILFVICASIAFRATGPCVHFDTGLYGATTVRWITSFPVVPGLANLHGRLGFNSSVMLCIAQLGQGPWRDLGHHLFSGMLLCALWFPILGALRTLGTMTDLPASVVLLVAVAMLLRQMSDWGADTSAANHRASRMVTTLSLITVGLTFKASVGPFAATLWIVGILWLVSHPSSDASRDRIAQLGPILISLMLVGVWAVHGSILSGYPFYPSTALSVPVDWRVSANLADVESAWVQSYARAPGNTLLQTRGVEWMRPWFVRVVKGRADFQVPLLLGLASLVSLICFRPTKRLLSLAKWLALPSAIGIGFWFWRTPAGRFGAPVIWTVAGVLTSLAVLSLRHAVPQNRNLLSDSELILYCSTSALLRCL